MRIERVEIFPVRYAMTGFFKFFADPKGNGGRAAVIIKITCDDGTVGWGQSVPIAKWSYETWETASILLHRYYGPALIGHDPEDLDGAHARMTKEVANGFTTGNPITRAGIDLALHDLAGKLRGQSLAQLWGLPDGEPLELSWTVNVTALDQIEAVIEDGRKRGFRHFNIKVGPDPRFDRELARLVRAAAPNAFLWADANTGYTLEAALEAARALADAGVDILEAPLPPNRIFGYRKLKQLGALPILMDEGVISPEDLVEFAELGMMDGVAMKPARCGGLLSNKRQIELCEERGLMWVGSGLTDPDISFAGTVGLYSACRLSKPAALNGPPQFLTEDVVKNPIRVENGRAWPARGPGLGVEVDEAKLAELMKRSGGDQLLKAIESQP